MESRVKTAETPAGSPQRARHILGGELPKSEHLSSDTH